MLIETRPPDIATASNRSLAVRDAYEVVPTLIPSPVDSPCTVARLGGMPLWYAPTYYRQAYSYVLAGLRNTLRQLDTGPDSHQTLGRYHIPQAL